MVISGAFMYYYLVDGVFSEFCLRVLSVCIKSYWIVFLDWNALRGISKWLISGR